MNQITIAPDKILPESFRASFPLLKFTCKEASEVDILWDNLPKSHSRSLIQPRSVTILKRKPIFLPQKPRYLLSFNLSAAHQLFFVPFSLSSRSSSSRSSTKLQMAETRTNLPSSTPNPGSIRSPRSDDVRFPLTGDGCRALFSVFPSSQRRLRGG